MRSSKPISVTLGAHQQAVDERVESGAYASASEVIRAALRALDREERALDIFMRTRIQEALDDDTPPSSLDEVFNRIEALHSERIKGDRS
jgi:antitoxin ParD1/3/4